MEDEIIFDGITHTSSRRAADISGLSREYLARLCRKGVIAGRRMGTSWYVDMESCKAFLRAQEYAREHRRQSLVRERSEEYYTRPQKDDRTQLLPVTPASEQKSMPEVRVRTNTQSPVVRTAGPVRDTHERMRRALVRRGRAQSETVLEASHVLPPGLSHAVFQNTSAQAIAHVPTHLVTPTLEFVHRLLALVTTFVFVIGMYSLFDQTPLRVAYDSASSSARTVAAAVEAAHFEKIAQQANVASAAFVSAADNPDAAFESVVKNISSLSATVTRTVARAFTPPQKVSYTAAASAAVPVVVSPQHLPAAFSTAPGQESLSSIPASEVAAAALTTSPPPAAKTTLSTNTARSVPSVGAYGSIATAITLTGTSVAYGDVVAYDPASNTYTLADSKLSGDARVFGVVVQQPALLFKPEGGGNVPVVRSGSALVNVTLENGSIHAGDHLAASSIPGKAKLAGTGDYVIGTAADAFTGAGGVTLRTPDGTETLSGTIPVQIDAVGTGSGSAPANTSACTSFMCKVLESISPDLVRTFARYLLSGLIAIVSLVFSFKSFVSDVNYGVISMGRNPRAKTSIQSMVLFNAFLAMAIASIGLFAAMFVLFATA